MQKILSKSLQDIFSKDVILFVLQIALAALAISTLIMWLFWGTFTSFIASYLSWIPWEWLKTSGASMLTFGLSYITFIIVVAILTSFYSEKLLIKLAKKHYPETEVVGSADIMTSLFLTLKATVIFIILLILLLVFLFIPIVGQIILLYLFSILLREPTLYDVSSLFIADKKVLKEKKKNTRSLAMIAALFNYVPFLNAFAAVFAQILFLHHILGKEKV